MSDSQNKNLSKATYTLISLLLCWAVLLAVGTLNFGQTNVLRPLFILGTIGTFVAIWLLALWRAG